MGAWTHVDLSSIFETAVYEEFVSFLNCWFLSDLLNDCYYGTHLCNQKIECHLDDDDLIMDYNKFC